MELILRDIVKKFDKKEVLTGASASFASGKIYGLLGRNGAGKTTLFNVLNHDLKADGGEALLADETGERELRTEDIGYVLSTPTVPAFLTAREFVRFFLEINPRRRPLVLADGRTLPEDTDADVYLGLVGIEEEDRGRLLRDFSHGMKSKVQLLVNILADTPVLLLDEPLTALDVVAAEEMKALLREIRQDKILILSTHIMELALTLCDDITLLTGGKLAALPETDETGRKLSDEEIRERVLETLREA